MKTFRKNTLLFLFTLSILFFIWFICYFRINTSNENKNVLFQSWIGYHERSGNNISFISENIFGRDIFYVPISNQKKITISLTQNWWQDMDKEYTHSDVKKLWDVTVFFKNKIFWLNEYIFPHQDIISKINNNTFEINLDKDVWYYTQNGKDFWYRIIGKWKTIGVYIVFDHSQPTEVEFSVID